MTARKEYIETYAKMVAVQEELDWECYRLYGLIDEDLTYSRDDLPGWRLGSERSRSCWLRLWRRERRRRPGLPGMDRHR